jgi:hypothetical protein
LGEPDVTSHCVSNSPVTFWAVRGDAPMIRATSPRAISPYSLLTAACPVIYADIIADQNELYNAHLQANC